MNDRQIIVGLLRLVQRVAEQQAMPDDSWEKDAAYLAAMELPITLRACKERARQAIDMLQTGNWPRWREANFPWPICCHCQKETTVPSDINSISLYGLCGTCAIKHHNGEIEVLEG